MMRKKKEKESENVSADASANDAAAPESLVEKRVKILEAPELRQAEKEGVPRRRRRKQEPEDSASPFTPEKLAIWAPQAKLLARMQAGIMDSIAMIFEAKLNKPDKYKLREPEIEALENSYSMVLSTTDMDPVRLAVMSAVGVNLGIISIRAALIAIDYADARKAARQRIPEPPAPKEKETNLESNS